MTATVGATTDERLDRVHRQLVEAVHTLTTSDGWQRMCAVAARFHRYSAHNMLLIGTQRPTATQVAGYHTWRSVGRNVRRGELGIAILAPVLSRNSELGVAEALDANNAEQPVTRLRGFRVVHVFDVAQTDGPELPHLAPELITGAVPDGLWDDVAQVIGHAGYRLIRETCAPANGRTDYARREVTVDPALEPAQATKTLLHELAHVQLHHPDCIPAGMTRQVAEIEAESVAYIVSTSHGLAADGYSVPYVTGWSGGDLALIGRTATRALDCARHVLTLVPPPEPDERVGKSRVAERQVPRTLQRDEVRSFSPAPGRSL